MKKTIITLCVVLVLALSWLGYRCFIQSSPRNSFDYVKNKLVNLSFSKTKGSAFIAQLGTKKYLITNEHVVRAGNGETPRAICLNGDILKLGDCEIAGDRDLIRFEVDSDCHPLGIAVSIPNVGDTVTVYGNSDGGGVSTQLSGQILGVGGDTIELDAQFVNGNSGSPVIDEHGQVVGVATYLTNYTNENDWVKSGTRFNGVRRYAMRLVNMPWIAVDWDEYSRQTRALNDIEYFLTNLRPFLFAWYQDVDEQLLQYSELNRQGYNGSDGKLHTHLIQVKNTYHALLQACEKWSALIKGKSALADYLKGKPQDEQEGLLDKIDDVEKDRIAEVAQRLFEFNCRKYDALTAAMTAIEKAQISIPVLKDGIADESGTIHLHKAIDVARMSLCEQYLPTTNIVEYADELMKSENVTDREIGSVLMCRIAKYGDEGARAKIIAQYENLAGDKAIYSDSSLLTMRPVLAKAFDDGHGKLGYILGLLAYDRMEYEEAEKYWLGASDAGVNAARARLGVFYHYGLGDGGAPSEMRSDKKAISELKKFCEADKGVSDRAPHVLYANLLTFSREKSIRNYKTALHEYSKVSEVSKIDDETRTGWVISACHVLATKVYPYRGVNWTESFPKHAIMNDYKRSQAKCSYSFDLSWIDSCCLTNYPYKSQLGEKTVGQIENYLLWLRKDKICSQNRVLEFFKDYPGTDTSQIALSLYREYEDERVRRAVVEKDGVTLAIIGDARRFRKEFASAFALFKKAAEFGNAYAMYRIGWCLEYGVGVAESRLNRTSAEEWYRKSASLGDWLDQIALGNRTSAEEWYRKSASLGDWRAQITLGNMLDDPVEKVKWFEMAAAQGVAEAQYYAGFFCEAIGWGIWRTEVVNTGTIPGYNDHYMRYASCIGTPSQLILDDDIHLPFRNDNNHKIVRVWGTNIDFANSGEYREKAIRYYQQSASNGYDRAAEIVEKVLPVYPKLLK